MLATTCVLPIYDLTQVLTSISLPRAMTHTDLSQLLSVHGTVAALIGR